MLKDITVLMSASSSPSMPGMIKCLRNNGERNIKVVGIDMTSDPSAKFMVDAFYQVPAVNDSKFCDTVLNICRKEKVDVYFPNVSAEVETVVARKSEFEALGVRLSVSNMESVAISNNKFLTYQTLEKAGIPVPRYYGVNSVEDFVEGMKYMGYPMKPVCIKIVNGSGSRGVRIIDANKSRYEIFAHEKPNSFFTSYEDMLAILKSADKLEEMMLVECMQNPEFTVDLLAERGEVIYEVGRENVVSLMSIAQETVVKYDKLAYKIGVDVVKLLKMDGNVGIDFMRNENGEAVLMDINPRITATVSVIAAAGVNLIYLRVKQLLGEELPKVEPVFGTRLRRRYDEMFTTPAGNLISF
ncbi:ATP-grasp domain-containing protein [Bacteroides ovatus]|uniref:ATP-grasp domain-containing protein n=1 Tax=Bacteroides ovatus TaxID=28116 RepID=UPI0018CAF36D|nr:ATP-grasp domain-containing protein [Bacteroides ovatus]MBG9220339.1 ATP-grasp domain-containing protein [Bacteroides ovatus]MBG9233463.1 ATP-grasp domain-containing protein [Bacteroides ovatus]